MSLYIRRKDKTSPETMIYKALNEPVFLSIPKNIQRLLDVGCGCGALGRQIKKNMNCEVVGITCSEEEAGLAGQWLDQVIVCDLNNYDTSRLGIFDCIICSHILEHLYQPQNLLKQLKNNLKNDGKMIVALPNAWHWKKRLRFLNKRWQYEDETHVGFFSWSNAKALLENNGYVIISAQAYGNFPLLFIRKFAQSLALTLDNFFVKILPGLFGVQFVIVVTKA